MNKVKVHGADKTEGKMPNYSGNEFIYVTGCDSGFGEIVVKKLDKLGYNVFAGVYLEESIQRLKKEGTERMHPLRVDVSNEESVERVAMAIRDKLREMGGKLVGIVNNAGILVQPGPVEWTDADAYRRMFNVNVMGTVMTTKSLIPLLRESKGRIVNVASIAGFTGIPTQPAYCASKFAVEGYSDVLRKDMLDWGITVHIIEPGIFSKTGLYDTFQTGLDDKWRELDPGLKAAYGEEYYKFVRANMVAALADLGSTKSELVPIAMIDALTSDKPKYRYKVGLDAKYLYPTIRRLHESTQDTLLTLSKNKVVRPAAAPKNGKQMALSRYDKEWPKFIVFAAIMLYVIRKVRK